MSNKLGLSSQGSPHRAQADDEGRPVDERYSAGTPPLAPRQGLLRGLVLSGAGHHQKTPPSAVHSAWIGAGLPGTLATGMRPGGGRRHLHALQTHTELLDQFEVSGADWIISCDPSHGRNEHLCPGCPLGRLMLKADPDLVSGRSRVTVSIIAGNMSSQIKTRTLSLHEINGWPVSKACFWNRPLTALRQILASFSLHVNTGNPESKKLCPWVAARKRARTAGSLHPPSRVGVAVLKNVSI